MPENSFLVPALSTIVAGAVGLVISFALAHCFPSKEMLDAEAVENEWKVP